MSTTARLKFLALRLYKGIKSGELRRGATYKLSGRYSPFIAVDRGDGIYLLPTRDMMGLKTFMIGNYDLDVMRTAMRLVSTWVGHDPLRDRTLIDVGGNIGTTTIPAVLEFGAGRVLAIEPDIRNLRLLETNIILNELSDRVTVVHAAATDSEGTVQLELSPNSVGDHRVRTSTDTRGTMGEGRRETVDVAARRLDDIVDDSVDDLAAVGLVWIDTQGHEGHVLAGAPRLIAAGIPFFIEYWPYGLRRGENLDVLHRIMAEDFSRVIDVRDGTKGRELSRDELDRLPDKYPGFNDYTDLLLIP